MVFVDVGEDLIMADDVVTPSNPSIAPIKEEAFEETLLDMNASLGSRDKESFQEVVCIQIDHSAWDCQLSPNPHALMICLEFVPFRGAMLERFKECQCEDDDVCLHC